MKEIHREMEFSERKKAQDFLVMLSIQHGNPEEIRDGLVARIQSMDANASGLNWWEHTELDRSGFNKIKSDIQKAKEFRVGKE